MNCSINMSVPGGPKVERREQFDRGNATSTSAHTPSVTLRPSH